jgi:hypothetical protein
VLGIAAIVAELFIVIAEQPWASGDSDKQQSTGIDKVHHLGEGMAIVGDVLEDVGRDEAIEPGFGLVILDRADRKAARAAGGGALDVVFSQANVGRFDVDAAHVVPELGQADRQIAATATDVQDPHERAVGEVVFQNVILGVGVDVLGS